MRIRKQYLKIIILIGLFMELNLVFSQTVQISQNKKAEFKKNYYPRENDKDTVYIVFDSHQEGVVSRKEIHMPDSYKFKYFNYVKSYSNGIDPNDQFIIFHNAGPVWGHEEFIVDRWKVNPLDIIIEEEKDFIFWKMVEGYIREYTVIVLEKNDWQSRCRYVKGWQMSIGALNVRE